jgi:uncharacterized protein (TIGR02246 family)
MKARIEKLGLAISWLVLLCMVFNCQQSATVTDVESEKAKVKAVIDGYIRAQETMDMQLLSKVFANDDDMVVIGTDTAEYLIGWDQVQAVFSQIFDSPDQMGIAVRNQSIKISQSGDVAWFSEIEDYSFVSQGQTDNFYNWRTTGVLEKRNGDWLIVQLHLSVPVSGQIFDY